MPDGYPLVECSLLFRHALGQSQAEVYQPRNRLEQPGIIPFASGAPVTCKGIHGRNTRRADIARHSALGNRYRSHNQPNNDTLRSRSREFGSDNRTTNIADTVVGVASTEF